MAGKLSVRTVATAKPGRHGDGGGLWLEVAPGGRRRWIFRFSFDRRVTEMSLGPAAAVTLAEARIAVNEARKLLVAGVNPIAAKRLASEAAAPKPTFGQCALELIKLKEGAWRNAKHRGQWRMTLTKYGAGLWPMPVDEIGVEHVLAALQPLWQGRPETASRLRGRIEAVLDAARVKGLRSGENPARWKGNLDHLLPRAKKLYRGHHAAMPYAEVPAFIAALREQKSIGAMALEFLVLTSARTGEVLGAQWNEINFSAKVWTVPAGRMKAGRQHRVPLTGPALAILEKLAQAKTGEFIFPGQRPGKPLSNMALEMVLRRMKLENATVHGFRSAFRDWAGDCTSFAREVAEAALAHVAGDATEQAYRRSDALEKRRKLMEAWGAFCEPTAGAVLPFKKKGAGA